jgi:broad specificity phosphatase PhoE
MPSELPRLFLARHGDTAWTDSRQRTGRTDIPLNVVGEDRARQFGERLRRFSFASVFTSRHFSPYNQTSNALRDVVNCAATNYGSNEGTSDVNTV